MKPDLKTVLSAFALLLVAASCSSDVKDDYNDVSFRLTDQNGEPVLFPDDLKGSPVVMGFVYTNCPDICSFITANLYKIYQELDQPDDIRFVIVTFDPKRDNPDVLKEYATAFSMDRPPFRFLTGPEDEIEAMMQRVGVRSQISYTKEIDEEEFYFLNHSDKILLLDRRSRLVMEYGGSMTPTHLIIEDLNRL